MSPPPRKATSPDPSGAAQPETASTTGSLTAYRNKRDPTQTPEPFADDRSLGAGSASTGLFVVQQHAARAMHWDLRLEINGALVSWAVPKGPALSPAEKRLAVQTEDHPLEYAGFEGIIPPGNYGAGAMIVWDRGAFRTVNDEAAAAGVGARQARPRDGRPQAARALGAGADQGRRRQELAVDTEGGAPVTGPELVVAQPASILSGLTIDELRSNADHTAALAQAALQAGASAARPRRSHAPADVGGEPRAAVLRSRLAVRGEV